MALTRLSLVLLVGCGRIGFGFAGDAPADALIPVARHWQLVTPPTRPPSATRTQLAYHQVRGSVLFYGGRSPTGISDELWEYAGGTWTRICTGCPPGRRESHGFGYDPVRDRIILYGGDNPTGTIFGDLWEWDGVVWQPRPVSGPPPLSHSNLVWDPIRRQSMLVAGYLSAGNYQTDLWAYDGTTWTRITTPTPAPSIDSSGPHAVWDDHQDRIVVYGAPSGAIVDDTWAWDGSDWTRVCTGCTGMPRIAADVVFDPRGGVLVQGGNTSAGEIAGTWRLDGDSFVMVSADPPARDTAALVYDPQRDVVVLYGGNGFSCPGDCDETWEYVAN